VGAGLVAFVVYALGAAPGVGFFDGGELTAAAFGLGVSHPPGQPLYSAIGKAVALVPLGDVAFRLNLLSAGAGAVAVGLLAWLGLLLELGEVGALVASVVLGASPMLIGQATRAEVYTPLLAVALLAACLLARSTTTVTSANTPSATVPPSTVPPSTVPPSTVPSPTVPVATVPSGQARLRDVLAGAFLLGLATAIHPLLAAAGAVPVAIVAVRGLGLRRSLRALGPAVLAALAGAAVYAYLPAAASRHPLVDWGGARTASAVWATISARAYASNFAVTPGTVLHNLGLLGGLWTAALSWPLVVVAVAGSVLLAVRRRAGLLALGLTGMVWIATAPQAVIFPENPDVSGYLLLGLAGLALGAGFAVLTVAAAIGQIRGGGRIVRIGGEALAALVVAAALLTTWRHAEPPPRGVRDAEVYADALLGAVPPRPPLLLLESDHALFPVLYDQAVAGARPDVPMATPDLVTSSWYLEDLARAHPQLFVPYVDDGGRTDSLEERLILGNLEHGAVLSELYGIGGWPPWRTGDPGSRWQVREAGLLFALSSSTQSSGSPGITDITPAPLPSFHGEIGRRIHDFIALIHDQFHAESDRSLDPRLYLLRAPLLTPTFIYDDRAGQAWAGDRAWAQGDAAAGRQALEQSFGAGYAEAGFALALHTLDEGDEGDEGDATSALQTLDAVIALRPGRKAEIDRAAGLVAVGGHHDDAATRWLEAVVTETPTDEPANVVLGDLAGRAGRFDDAIDRFQAALQGNADSEPALFGLAAALARSGRSADAVPVLQHLLAIDPGRDDVRALLTQMGAASP
jgi:hypothetical protein